MAQGWMGSGHLRTGMFPCPDYGLIVTPGPYLGRRPSGGALANVRPLTACWTVFAAVRARCSSSGGEAGIGKIAAELCVSPRGQHAPSGGRSLVPRWRRRLLSRTPTRVRHGLDAPGRGVIIKGDTSSGKETLMSLAIRPPPKVPALSPGQAAACPAACARATPRPAASGCTTSRPGRGRSSCYCMASPSSGTAGATSCPRRPPPAFASSPPDLRGYNDSDKPKGVANYRMELLTADVVGPDPARGQLRHRHIAFAHDWGGGIAWNVAVQHPKVVDRLAILNAAHPREARAGTAPPRPAPQVLVLLLLHLPTCPKPSCTPTAGISSGTSCATPARPSPPEQTSRYIQAWSQPGAATAMINYYRSSVRTPPKKAEAQIHTVKAPTLVMAAATATSAPKSAEP